MAKIAKNTGKTTAATPRESSPADSREDGLDPQAELSAVRGFAADPKMAASLHKLCALAGAGPRHSSPDEPCLIAGQAADAAGLNIPKSLLIEGGTVQERLMAALYWAALLNCGARTENGPCLNCPDCLRMVGRIHRDCFFLDGRSESIKIDSVREVRSILGEGPREALFRIVIFCEAQAMGEAAANSLLKSLEEPRPGTSFLLLAPQRERLLPTLVSRSWILTLPWPSAGEVLLGESGKELIFFGQALLRMAQNGAGWMEHTSRKGAVDKNLALGVVLMCQHALREALVNAARGPEATPLSAAFARLPAAKQRMLDEILAECQDSLEYSVNPALVMDWLATRFHFILKPVMQQHA